MGKRKYQSGDLVGPYHIQLLDYITKTSYGHSICSFICPTCQKEFEYNLYAVVRGNIKQCSDCAKKDRQERTRKINFKDLSGQRFGKLIAKQYLRSDIKGYTSNGKKLTQSIWLCECDCGRKCEVGAHLLTNNIISSCPYCHLNSRGEYKIAAILEQLNIIFTTQKTFQNCLNPDTNVKLRFDFYLPDYNICIEYDGTTHYLSNLYGSWNTQESVDYTRYKDKIKTNFCRTESIGLIRIPYWDFNKLSEEYLKELLESHRGGEVDELQRFSESNRQSC